MIRTRVASSMAVVGLGFVTAPAASADTFERSARLCAVNPGMVDVTFKPRTTVTLGQMFEALNSQSRTGLTFEQLSICNELDESDDTLDTMFEPGKAYRIITSRAFV